MENDSLGNKIWSIIYPLVIYLSVSVIVQIIFYVIIMTIQFYQLESGIGHSVELMDNIQEIIQKYSVLMTLISALITLFVFYKLFRYKINFNFNNKLSKNYIYVAALAAFSSIALSRLISLLPLDNIIGNYEEVGQRIFSGNIILEIITIAVIVPILEEIIFRGIVYNRLKQFTHKYAAIIVTSLMFGVYHMNLVQGIYAFIFSLLLIFVYEKFKTILAPVLMHAVANGLSIFLTYTGISEFINKNIFVYIIVMLLEFFATGIIIIMLRKKVLI